MILTFSHEWGGDEFVVLLTDTLKQQAEKIIGRFGRSLKKYNQEVNCGYDIAFSYGIVEYNPEKDPTIDELLAKGDSLMYQVKKAKR